MRLDASGRLGIGTTSPGSYNADGNQLVVGSGSGNQGLTINAGASSLASIFFAKGTAGSDPVKSFIKADGATEYLAFGTANAERFRCDSSGRLLVGTSTNNASYKLQIVHTDATGVLLGCFNGGTNYLSTLSSNGSEASKTVVSSGHELFTINATGYDGSANRTAATISAQVDGTPGAGDMPGRLVFSTTADGASSPTERMRINASGQTLIGKASDTLSTPGWAIDGGSFIGRGQLTCGSTGAPILRLNHTGGAGTEYVVESWKNGTPVGSITVTASATSYNTSSDYRLKENVTLLTGATDRLKQIPVHRFNFIADPDTTVDGFLAHEAQAVVPECITGTKDEVDDDGNPVYQGIDQSKLVPLLTAALQEAIAKIETLEGMVAVNNITIDEQQHQLSTLAARLTALESA
jgi:hypothetical protein